MIFITQASKLNIADVNEEIHKQITPENPIVEYSDEAFKVILLHDGFGNDIENLAENGCQYLMEASTKDTFVIYHANMADCYLSILKDKFRQRSIKDIHESSSEYYIQLNGVITDDVKNPINHTAFNKLYGELEQIFNGNKELSIILNSLHGLLGQNDEKKVIKEALTGMTEIKEFTGNDKFDIYRNSYIEYLESTQNKVEKLKTLRDALLDQIV